MERDELRNSLREDVIHLISLRQEGGFWDFKRQWHDKKRDLLHDIICMANNLHNRTAYIIIGVDEENDYDIVDIKTDPNRKNTQKIVDFMRDKKFAGGIRPVVHVESVNLYRGEVDVIVIENSYNTPFYLTEQFEGIRANYIYTRVMDTNTPIDRSADINNIEQLWRKRFRIDEMPIVKFDQYLQSADGWEVMPDTGDGYFYKYAPEYALISEKDDRDGYEYYLFGQVDTRPHWRMITMKYHQTAIGQYLGASLDGGRCFIVAPDRAWDLYDIGIGAVGFYVEDDFKVRLMEFYHNKEYTEEYSFANFLKAIVVFASRNEYTSFVKYLKENKARYEELCEQQGENGLPMFPELEGYNIETFKKLYRDALVLKKMLGEFRSRAYS